MALARRLAVIMHRIKRPIREADIAQCSRHVRFVRGGFPGQLEEARAQAAQLLRLDPGFVSNRARDMPFEKYFRPEDAEHLADGLRKAGLSLT